MDDQIPTSQKGENASRKDKRLTENIMILVEPKLFEEIETLRKREPRSIFVRYLLKLGLVEYKKKQKEA